ncbi:MAG TPA: hypothetical protein VHM67_09505 [Gemmatimonadaceae bacterium]|nr:hypothetical protein [Gemmatimonadaceae bacterium]
MTAIPLALIIIVIWGVGTFYFEPPGWFHGLLTGGLFLLFWGIVVRRREAPRTPAK